MSKLKSSTRNRLPARDFGLPEERKYPMEDKHHAANAKARATQAYDKGRITKAEEDRIDAKANRKLHGVKPLKEHELEHWGE